MKITLKQLDESFHSLTLLSNIDFSVIKASDVAVDFPNFSPSKTSYDIKRRLKVLLPEIELINEEKRNIQKRISDGKTKNDGKEWDMTLEQSEEANKEIKEFLSKEIEIDVQPLKYSSLGKALPPIHLFFLDYLLEE